MDETECVGLPPRRMSEMASPPPGAIDYAIKGAQLAYEYREQLSWARWFLSYSWLWMWLVAMLGSWMFRTLLMACLSGTCMSCRGVNVLVFLVLAMVVLFVTLGYVSVLPFLESA